MDLISRYIALTDGLLDQFGLSHPMAHVHAGLAIYLCVQMLLRTRRASGIALQAVFGAEIVNEILQRAYYGSWRWSDTLGDIALTVMWPTLLYGMAKFRRAKWKSHEGGAQDGVRISQGRGVVQAAFAMARTGKRDRRY